jgi:hypothetical protein
MRYERADFHEMGEMMAQALGLRLTFDSGQQLDRGISSLFDLGLCDMSKGEKQKFLMGAFGVMGKPTTVTLMPTDRFDIDQFATIMFELKASITDIDYVERDDWPVPASTNAFPPDVTRSSEAFLQ